MAKKPDYLIFGCDHAGLELKNYLIAFAKENGFSVIDCGVDSMQSVDYPDYAFKVVDSLQNHDNSLGVLICGSGLGMSIAANRFKGIRAALCSHEYEAQMAREHNNANILCLGARVVGTELAKACLSAFLTTSFAEGKHLVRINKIDSICDSNFKS